MQFLFSFKVSLAKRTQERESEGSFVLIIKSWNGVLVLRCFFSFSSAILIKKPKSVSSSLSVVLCESSRFFPHGKISIKFILCPERVRETEKHFSYWIKSNDVYDEEVSASRARGETKVFPSRLNSNASNHKSFEYGEKCSRRSVTRRRMNDKTESQIYINEGYQIWHLKCNCYKIVSTGKALESFLMIGK